MATQTKAFGVCIYKKEFNTIMVLLCKSVTSKQNWGLIKGLHKEHETFEECAQRELYEESHLEISIKSFERYFEQSNPTKDIGIWLVNAHKIKNIGDYFDENRLFSSFLSWENSAIEFFNIDQLPPIKKKQVRLMENITHFLRSSHQFH